MHVSTLVPDDVVTTLRLLLVEDDDGDAFLVRELLQEAGAPVHVLRARSVAEAVAPGGRAPDCVLLDLGLPDASGLDALHSVLAAAPTAAVIVLTGLADEHRAVQAVAAGAQDYLVKGQVDGPLLSRAIRYAVERSRADAELRRLYAGELQAAENARLERGLLPSPQVVDPRLTVVSRYRPGRDALLGGDFFDVVEAADGTVHAVIGDVCGHGPDEAALGVALRIAWRTLVLAGVDSDSVLPVLEDVLVRERRTVEPFATVAMVTVAPGRGSALMWLAGHPAPLLLGPPARQLPDDLVGPPLGVAPGVRWGRREVPLEGAWRLVLFSDGLVEGYSGEGHGARLDVDGLLRLVAASGTTTTGHLLDELIEAAEALNAEPLPDDVAVLALEHAP
jgi:DNA-binding NarL/FixJ family response regulator